MTWLQWYAIGMTLLAVVLALGWYNAHALIVSLADIEANEWPFVRKLISQKLRRAERTVKEKEDK